MNIVGDYLQQIYTSHHSNQTKHSQQNIQTLLAKEAKKLDLSENVMREFYYNCDQITEIYETLTQSKIDLSTYTKPTPTQYSNILKILLSTFYRNVCKLEENNKYKNRDQETMFIHRMSMLYKNQNSSLFVGCVEFFVNDTNKRKYMRYPFKV